MTIILVIEDERPIRENIVETLEAYDFEVLVAEDGVTGIQLAGQEIPALILCDIMMPEMDGYAVLRALQDNPSTAMIPFIFLSALADRQSVRRGMELGADDYVGKPFTPQELLHAVEARLAKYAAAIKHVSPQAQDPGLAPNVENATALADEECDPGQPVMGRNLRGYHFLEKIGEGGVGVVYKAYQA